MSPRAPCNWLSSAPSREVFHSWRRRGRWRAERCVRNVSRFFPAVMSPRASTSRRSHARLCPMRCLACNANFFASALRPFLGRTLSSAHLRTPLRPRFEMAGISSPTGGSASIVHAQVHRLVVEANRDPTALRTRRCIEFLMRQRVWDRFSLSSWFCGENAGEGAG